jgi:hypothetical protein
MNVEELTTDSVHLGNSLKRDIFNSLRKGFSFLSKSQLKSGEFPMMRWEKNNRKDASYVKTVFATSFVLHSLKYVRKFLDIDKISQKAIMFLFNETENDLWRFYGKGSRIHFDLDTSCCALASLKEYDIDLDYETIATKLLKYRNTQGIFNTWILDIDPPFKKVDNNVDWVVNANVLFFYSLLGWNLPEVEQYLIKVVENGIFKERSPYYDSPLCFIYCLTRAYADGNNSTLSPTIPKIRNYLLDIIRNNLLNDPLEKVLAIVGLLNCGVDSTTARYVIKHLLRDQRKDGKWLTSIFFTEGPYTEYRVVYGSEALTTAIALEAISKYAERYDELAK